MNSIYVEGTQAGGNRKIYLVNGNYNDTSRKGLIMYELEGNAMATNADQGTQLIGPSYFGYYPYDVARDSSGNWYMNQYRSAAGEAPALSKFDGSIVPNNSALWEVPNSYFYADALDINDKGGVVAIGRGDNGLVYFFSTATGDLMESFDCGSSAREMAFDIAGNLVTVDNVAEYARFWSPGGYTEAITKSDNTFQVITRDSLIVNATNTTLAEVDSNSATFTISRFYGEGQDLEVYFTMTGTATSNVDYTLSVTSPFIFKAGEVSTNITITPIGDSVREATETVILTPATSALYYVRTPGSATATIVDDDFTPAYWDPNSDTAGAGYDASGNWSDAFWSTSADGTSTTGAWTDGAAPVFSAGTDAMGTFTITNSGTRVVDRITFEEGYVTLDGGTLQFGPADNTVSVAASANATINSVLSGSGLTKADAGPLILGKVNTYTGATAVNGGLLQLAANELIPNGSALTVAAGATFDLVYVSETVGSLSGAGVINLYAGGVLTFGTSSSTTWDGTTQGGGLLAKVGTGTLTIGSGTIADTLAISNGIVTVNSDTDLGAASTADLIVNGGRLRNSSHDRRG